MYNNYISVITFLSPPPPLLKVAKLCSDLISLLQDTHTAMSYVTDGKMTLK